MKGESLTCPKCKKAWEGDIQMKIKNKTYIRKQIPTLAGYVEIFSKRKWKGIIYLIEKVRVKKDKKYRNGGIYRIKTAINGKLMMPSSKILLSEREAIKEARQFIDKKLKKSRD